MIRRYAFSGLVHLVQLSIAFLTLLNVDTNHPTDRRAEGSRVKDRRLLSVDRRAAAHVGLVRQQGVKSLGCLNTGRYLVKPPAATQPLWGLILL
jgi:hypothetical protein